MSFKPQTSPVFCSLLLAVFALSSHLCGEVTITSLGSSSQSIRVLGGGWDYYRNGRPEVLALRSSPDSTAPDELIYLELTAAAPVVLWSYRPADEGVLLVDAQIADLGGNGTPELVVLLHHQALTDNASPDWLVFFTWDATAEKFNTEPGYRWNYRGRGVSYLRPTGLLVSDLDNDGNDELVITVGSPDRMVLVADWRRRRLRASSEFRPQPIISGSRPFTVAVVDFNGDVRRDLLIIGQGERPQLIALINGRGGFNEVAITDPLSGPVLPAAIAIGDLDGDGQEEAVLPHSDGSLTLVSMAGPRLRATRLDTAPAGLLDLAIVDIDGDGSGDLLYLLSDGTLVFGDERFAAPLNPAMIKAQLPAGVSLPESYQSLIVITGKGDRPGRLLLSAASAAGPLLIMADPPSGPFPPSTASAVALAARAAATIPPQVEAGELPALPLVAPPLAFPPAGPPGAALEPEVPGVEGGDVYFQDRRLSPDPRALPPHRTPDVLLYAGDEFTRNVLGERAEEFAHFRFLRKPPGMVFNFQRQAIVWQPTDQHFGAWNVEFEITFQTGVSYEDVVTDSAQDFKVVPKLEVVHDQMLIYVNDKPLITSHPDTERLLAGNLFAYRIQVDDRNADARVDFRLESGPEGMILDRNGILTWRTNEAHHDNYQVVISATDGFDKDVQTFTVNVNAQLTLTSTAPNIARPQKPYNYEVTVFQPGSERQYTYSLPRGPEGMSISQDGIISWTPAKTQLDTHRFEVRITDGISEDVQGGWVYVNAPPRIIDAPSAAMTIMAGDTLGLNFQAEDPNEISNLQWVISKGPLEMNIDSSGRLTWPTTLDDLDAHRFTVELADGMDKTQFRGVVFVNSQLTIASAPVDSALVGQTYAYQVETRDDNQATLLKFRRPTVVTDLGHTHGYRIEIQDDKFRRDLPRYIARFREQKNIYVNRPQRPGAGETAQAARVDLKEAVTHLFVDNEALIVIFVSPLPGAVELEDVLWEFFEGGRGLMPKYRAQPVPLVYFSLREFPDGMTVTDEGLIKWVPTPNQAGLHQVRLVASDGYTRDEQAFEVYANYAPAILSQPDTLASSEKRYSYQLQVDDRNEDAELSYRLIKAPAGMQVDSKGRVTWVPTVEQLNWHEFIVEVSDGHATDRQAATLFVNMPPRLLSRPKPVALNNYEYSYRLVAEDLNRDPIKYKALKLPRYSEFDARTGLFKWRPRTLQKGPNDIIFEITDSHGGVTLHEFQVHVFEDPSRERFLLTSWPLMMAFAGVIFVLGLTVGG